MNSEFFEIYKIRYNKILNSTQIMYKSLASYKELAMPLKKVLKEADLYIQSIIVLSLIKANDQSLELFKEIDSVVEYESLLKHVKIKKLKCLDESVLNKINDVISKKVAKEPFFLRIAAFFDSVSKKLDPNTDVSGCLIIKQCFLSMLALVRNEDETQDNLKKYNKDIKTVVAVLEK